MTELGVSVGLTSGGGAIVGVLLGGALSPRLIRRDRRWELWHPALAYAASAPLYIAAFLSSSTTVAIACMFFAVTCIASSAGVAQSAIQSFAEPHRRATAIAFVLFLGSLIGLGGGPVAVGAVSDALSVNFGEDGLRFALAFTTLVLLLASAYLVMAARHASADHAELMQAGVR
jgi:MFS family permease